MGLRATGGIFEARSASIPAAAGKGVAKEEPASPAGPPSTPDELRVYRAMKFLEAVLAHGPLPSTWVMAEGKRQGHTGRTLRRARLKQNVQALKSRSFNGSLWYMALPGDPVVALFKSRRRGDRQAAIERIKQSVEQFQARDSPEAANVG